MACKTGRVVEVSLSRPSSIMSARMALLMSVPWIRLLARVAAASALAARAAIERRVTRERFVCFDMILFSD